MSLSEVINWLKRIRGQFERDRGVRIWGYCPETDEIILFRVTADGELKTVSP